MKKIQQIIFLFGIIGITSFSCEKEKDEIKQTEGYIVGFDPCTINHHYRIGYVIISTDLKDTLVTYNLSDNKYRMPSSVINNLSDTLYKIPESYFQNFINSAYFPNIARYEFKIKVSYYKAKENEKIINICTTDINQVDFAYQFDHNQVIIISATKY